jgi:hypothetical protein
MKCHANGGEAVIVPNCGQCKHWEVPQKYGYLTMPPQTVVIDTIKKVDARIHGGIMTRCGHDGQQFQDPNVENKIACKHYQKATWLSQCMYYQKTIPCCDCIEDKDETII